MANIQLVFLYCRVLKLYSCQFHDAGVQGACCHQDHEAQVQLLERGHEPEGGQIPQEAQPSQRGQAQGGDQVVLRDLHILSQDFSSYKGTICQVI